MRRLWLGSCQVHVCQLSLMAKVGNRHISGCSFPPSSRPRKQMSESCDSHDAEPQHACCRYSIARLAASIGHRSSQLLRLFRGIFPASPTVPLPRFLCDRDRMALNSIGPPFLSTRKLAHVSQRRRCHGSQRPATETQPEASKARTRDIHGCTRTSRNMRICVVEERFTAVINNQQWA